MKKLFRETIDRKKSLECRLSTIHKELNEMKNLFDKAISTDRFIRLFVNENGTGPYVAIYHHKGDGSPSLIFSKSEFQNLLRYGIELGFLDNEDSSQ